MLNLNTSWQANARRFLVYLATTVLVNQHVAAVYVAKILQI